MDAFHFQWEGRTALGGVTTECNQAANFVERNRLQSFGPLACDVDADFPHDLNRQRMDPLGIGSRAENPMTMGRELTRKSLGHLAATGISSAEEKGRALMLYQWRGWKQYSHGRPFLHDAFDLQLAAVDLNDMFDNRQTEAGAAQFA